MSENEDKEGVSQSSEPKLKRLEETFLQDLGDAVSVRTVALILGVLLLGLGFILSYVGAFHDPTPHRIPIAVVAPAGATSQVVRELNGLPGEPLQATSVASDARALSLIRDGSTDGVFIVSTTGRTDSLLVASGGGASLSTAVETVVSDVETAAHRGLDVKDVVPSQPGDARGLSSFYLVVGWLVGGYLAAALLGIASGARPTSGRRSLIRLLIIAVYAVLAGLGGAVVVGPVFEALTGHFLALWAIGTLLVFCAAAVTMAFQVLFGVFGIGLTLLLFVILGNPSAGGAYSASLLPTFWRAISSAIPNGAAVLAIRRVVYFHAYDVAGNLLVIALWAVFGAAIALIVSRYRAHPVLVSGLSASSTVE
jgi:hypothetical protein